MLMLGLPQGLATSICLLAQAADSEASLGFGPLKLVFWLAWFYACLYLVKQTESSPVVPLKYIPLVRVAMLFAGPVVFVILVLIDTKNSPEEGNFLVRVIKRARNQISSAMRLNLANQQEQESKLQLFDSLGTELSQIYGRSNMKAGDRSVFDLTAQIIDNALQSRASDILIDPKDEQTYAVRLRIDGTLRIVRLLTADTSRAVLNSIKAVSSMDIAERRRPQDGAFTAKKADARFSFRVASAGALNGEKMSIRVLNPNADKFTLADAGIPDRQRAVIASAVSKPSGMVLVCGPTGSGKTTTLYAMLNHVDRRTHNVITVEDPIEAYLPEVSQLEINPKADITFAKALRSILRQDPDVICVGEIRDEETAEIALRAAQTGHLVLATIHCDSNANALIRLLDLGVSSLLMSSGLNVLLSQRLMRRLCTACRKPAQLSPTMAEKIRKRGFSTDNIYEPAGCPQCGGTGYFGRTAICDILQITDELRGEIAHNADVVTKLRSEGELKGRSNMKREALARVLVGISSIEELKRVVG